MGGIMSARRWCFALAGAAAVLAGTMAAAAPAETKFKITLDTGPNHIRNITVKQFVEKLKTATNGGLIGEVFESGQLYTARDEPRAVARGDVAMAVTTTAALASFDPNIDMVGLPIFSGLPPEQTNRFVDGPIGQDLGKRLGDKLGVVVPGRWLLLGFVHSYSTRKAINSFDDFKGMRVRIPGGPNFISRLKTLGATAVSIPFADVPVAMTQGTIDALLTTDETIRSGKLTESGLKFGFVDYTAVIYYVPIVNAKFWKDLGPANGKVFADAWEAVIPGERTEAVTRQAAARKANEAAGVQYVEPNQAALAAVREKLVAGLPELVQQLKLDPTLVERAKQSVAGGR